MRQPAACRWLKQVNHENECDAVHKLVRQAGAAIMAIYDGDHVIEYKDDNSPLTAADRAAHEIIATGLAHITPEIPVLSEEGRDIPYAERSHWSRFWLVDPLDGTKEFIKRNGQFTVNIAMIEGESPVFGMVYLPAKDRLYWGGINGEAFVSQNGGPPMAIHVRPVDAKTGLTVVMSRSHPSPELDDFLKDIKVADTSPVGSSLKFCVVAEGRADLYPRFGPTMEWDTAAGQAVVEGAGGQVLTLAGTRMRYNKESLLNPYFIVSGAGSW
jgi:3'(2'), 5'-bisphosphate nucleotidase